MYRPEEIMETIEMISVQNLDVRTVTMGINVMDCADPDLDALCSKIKEKVLRYAGNLVGTADGVAERYGIPIVNKRVSLTPISFLLAPLKDADPEEAGCAVARSMDDVAKRIGIDFIGGYSALVEKGFTDADRMLLESLPAALASTERVCSSVNVASTKAGINMDAVLRIGALIKDIAARTADSGGIGCAKLVVFANAPSDNPFMAGAFHGAEEPEAVVSVGISGPGTVKAALDKLERRSLGAVAEEVKRTAFKITRVGELIGREMAGRLDVEFGIIDISLAPSPTRGDSVGEILETMGLQRAGAPGSTAALALLTDAVKKGGAMATSYVGGLSGAFIPVCEDPGLVEAAAEGALTLEKLEAMTSVCSVGLDMIAVPGDTPAETLSAIIADEAAIGVINNKTTASRLIPVPGKKAGETVSFGGLLGGSTIMPVSKFASKAFIARGGRIPAPVKSLRN